jgi:hypothetical protein
MSEIKVDTLTGKTTATTVTGPDLFKSDELQGKTSAGDITVTSGSVTFKMQDSLIKHWTIFDQTGTLQSLGSFNQTSLTDVAVGRTDVNFVNNFSSAVNICITISNSYALYGCWYQIGNTAHYRIVNYFYDAYTDFDHSSGKITGDLA